MLPKIHYGSQLQYLLRHAGELQLSLDRPPSAKDLQSYERAARLLRNIRLTAEFTYHFPDFPDVVAEPLIRQMDDVAPFLPQFFKFIRFWNRELIGPLVSVEVEGTELVGAHEIRALKSGNTFYLH